MAHLTNIINMVKELSSTMTHAFSGTEPNVQYGPNDLDEPKDPAHDIVSQPVTE